MPSLLLAVAAGAGLVLGAAIPAKAEIARIEVLAEREIGPFAGKPYREVEARMEGTAPGGAYSVPVTLALPKRASDHNGFAIVDVVNTITIYYDNWVLGGQPLPLARGHMGDAFLFGPGQRLRRRDLGQGRGRGAGHRDHRRAGRRLHNPA